MKTCKKCGTEKNIELFFKNVKSKDGLRSSCKECMTIYTAKWRDNNKDKSKAYNTKWYKNNIEKVKSSASNQYKKNTEKRKSYSARYREENTEKCKEYNTQWRKNNKEKARTATANWIKNNPETTRIYCQNRRALKRANGGKLSPGLVDKLFKLQRGKCPCCNQLLGDNYHMDHIMPLSLGGSNTDDNIQLLRAICNIQKHAKHPIDFMQSRGFLI